MKIHENSKSSIQISATTVFFCANLIISIIENVMFSIPAAWLFALFLSANSTLAAGLGF
jgi:hypothetical protein